MNHETTPADDDLDDELAAADDFTDEELTAGTYMLSTRRPGAVSGPAS
jgi:hypothetical protein